MARYILKFGGTSVANVTRLRHVARIIAKQAEAGHELIVVVSAMAGITNELLQYTNSLCPDKLTEEHNVVLSSGEQVTSGLLALALIQLGLQSRSYLAWQIPIYTDNAISQASITNITTDALENCLSNNIIPVVAGFQGLNPKARLSTLGRGGSDTTAVALAAALKADRCDIYTDVEGVYNVDPRLVSNAKKLDEITYAEMLEMAAQGAKVLQACSVELAMKNKVKLRVLSSFVETKGTDIVEERKSMENILISGIAQSNNQVKITLRGVPHKPGNVASIVSILTENRIPLDMLVQSPPVDQQISLTFTITSNDLERTQHALKELQKVVPFAFTEIDVDVAKISVIGMGIKGNATVLNTLLATLAKHQIDSQLLTSSEIKISVIIDKQYSQAVLNDLYQAYHLEGDA